MYVLLTFTHADLAPLTVIFPCSPLSPHSSSAPAELTKGAPALEALRAAASGGGRRSGASSEPAGGTAEAADSGSAATLSGSPTQAPSSAAGEEGQFAAASDADMLAELARRGALRAAAAAAMAGAGEGTAAAAAAASAKDVKNLMRALERRSGALGGALGGLEKIIGMVNLARVRRMAKAAKLSQRAALGRAMVCIKGFEGAARELCSLLHGFRASQALLATRHAALRARGSRVLHGGIVGLSNAEALVEGLTLEKEYEGLCDSIKAAVAAAEEQKPWEPAANVEEEAVEGSRGAPSSEAASGEGGSSDDSGGEEDEEGGTNGLSSSKEEVTSEEASSVDEHGISKSQYKGFTRPGKKRKRSSGKQTQNSNKKKKSKRGQSAPRRTSAAAAHATAAAASSTASRATRARAKRALSAATKSASGAAARGGAAPGSARATPARKLFFKKK